MRYNHTSNPTHPRPEHSRPVPPPPPPPSFPAGAPPAIRV